MGRLGYIILYRDFKEGIINEGCVNRNMNEVRERVRYLGERYFR